MRLLVGSVLFVAVSGLVAVLGCSSSDSGGDTGGAGAGGGGGHGGEAGAAGAAGSGGGAAGAGGSAGAGGAGGAGGAAGAAGSGGAGGGTASCTPPGAVVGSCTQGTACTEFYAGSVYTTAVVQQACASTSTFSANECPRTGGWLGCCVGASGAYFGSCYYGTASTVYEQVCTQSSGAWCTQ